MRLKQAVKHFGTQIKVAEICQVTPQAVSLWESRGGGVVPIKKAWRLERASKGKLSMRLSDYR